jgi:hypothetical protein
MMTAFEIVYEGKAGAVGCSANRTVMTTVASDEATVRAWCAEHMPNVVIVAIHSLGDCPRREVKS